MREALRAATEKLAAVSDTPRLDAELLMAHALGIAREDLILGGFTGEVPGEFEPLLDRRLAHEPIAYIIGWRDFWTIRLDVGPGVLIPRPDSETLIEAAIAHFKGTSGPKSILDLGTGSGALLLAALNVWPEAHGIGVDSSTEAMRWARANVRKSGLRDRARIVNANWTGIGGPHDLVLCNPPYIATGEVLLPDVANHEPYRALYAGDDGLDDYRMIAPVLGPQLAQDGVACIEIGSLQGGAVRKLFEAEGFIANIRQDLAGCDRAIILTH